jgi:hypothetical protein
MHPVECVHVEPKSIPTIVRREADAILIKEKRAFTEDHVFVQPWLGGENTVKEIADMSSLPRFPHHRDQSTMGSFLEPLQPYFLFI